MDVLHKKDANLASYICLYLVYCRCHYSARIYCMVGIINGKNMDESGRDLIDVISHNFLGGSEEYIENSV